MSLFDKEEKLRRALANLGRVHDGVEAEGALNPKGEEIPDPGKPKRRRIPRWVKKRWKEVRGYPWPG